MCVCGGGGGGGKEVKCNLYTVDGKLAYWLSLNLITSK